MGDSLKRAVAAAIRRRSDTSLTPEMRDFLLVLDAHEGPVTRKKVGCVTSQAESRARRTCQRLGYAETTGKWAGPSEAVSGWQITAAGRRALNAETPSPSPETDPPHPLTATGE